MIHKLQEFLHKLPSSILISEEQYWKFCNDEVSLRMTDLDDEDIYISFQLLQSLLDNRGRYQKTLKFMRSNADRLVVGFFEYGTIEGYHFTRRNIVESIEYALKNGYLEANSQHLEQFEALKNTIGFDKLVSDYGDQFFSFEADGNTYRVPIHNLFNIVSLSDEGLRVFCTNPSVSKIQSVPKDKLLYGVKAFFKDPKICNEYYFPEEVRNRLNSILNNQYYDIQAINEITETKNFPFRDKEIDKDLENAILDGMPEDSNQLEKAIYIYIKMCSLLSYDPEFFAVNQKGPLAEKHKNPNMLEKINLTNNKVVCFEFNWIYGKMLDKLGIPFVSLATGEGDSEKTYGDGHAKLNFRVGKYLVSADAVRSVLTNDLMNVKTRRKLNGLVCYNQNQDTHKEFLTYARKMYDLVIEQQKKKTTSPTSFSMKDLAFSYRQHTDNIKEVSISERFRLWEEKAQRTDLEPMEYYGYLTQIKKALFTDEMLNDNFRFSIVRNNEEYIATGHYGLQAIIAKNDLSFSRRPEDTEYYYLEQGILIPMDKESVLSDFDNKTFEYIGYVNTIPGIKQGGIKK